MNSDHQITSASSATEALEADHQRPDLGLSYREFTSILPRQFELGTLIRSDGRGDAWKSRASQTTHQDFLIGVLAVSSSRRVAATVPKSDSQKQKSDVPAHKRLPKMCPIYSLNHQTRVLSDSDSEQGRSIWLMYKMYSNVFLCTGHFPTTSNEPLPGEFPLQPWAIT